MPNTITFDEMLTKATELGEQAGKGVDTQIKFMLTSVEGGYHNTCDLAKNKHGTDIDDATKLSEAYFKARTGSVVFDCKAPNQRKLISTVRTGIKLGAWPKGGNGEPVATVNNLMTIRQNLRKIPGNSVKLDDAVNVLMKYARTQLKRDQLVSDEELKQMCFKKTHDAPTEEERIEAVAKKIEGLIKDGIKTPHIINARHEMRQELAAIAKAKNPQIKAGV
jgi:hypothetical protein